MMWCCDVSLGLVQRYEWHWRIFGDALYGTSFLADGIMWFLQAHSLSKCLGIQARQAGSQINLACLVSGRGEVQPSCAGSPIPYDVLETQTWRHWSVTIIKCHQRSQIIQNSVKPCCQPVREIISKQCTIVMYYPAWPGLKPSPTGHLLKYSRHCVKRQGYGALCFPLSSQSFPP